MKNKLNMKRDKGWKTKYKFCVIDSIILNQSTFMPNKAFNISILTWPSADEDESL